MDIDKIGIAGFGFVGQAMYGSIHTCFKEHVTIFDMDGPEVQFVKDIVDEVYNEWVEDYYAAMEEFNKNSF